jgi:hypothetical protein
MEIEQRCMVSYLHRKGMKLPAIAPELAEVHHKDAFDGKEWNIGYMRLNYIVLIWVIDRVPADPSWRYRCSNSTSLGSWAMVFGSNNRWVPQDSCVDGASPSNHFSQHGKPTIQMGSSFSCWRFESKTIGGCPTASRCPAGTREMPFLSSNYRKWGTGLPGHEVRGYLASGWRRTTSPCQKDNCKIKVHAGCFLGNSRDRALLLAPKR